MQKDKQIDETMKALTALWKKYPENRLCQLLSNVVQPGSVAEFFYCEDSSLLKHVKEYNPTRFSK